MKINLDENLPFRLATLLKELGHDVQTLQDERLLGHPDTEIWRAAPNESRFLVTQDMDFSDRRRFAPGSHNGILLVRLRSPGRRDLIGQIQKLFRQENVGEWTGCFVVATERKIRVLGPGTKAKS